MAQSTIVFLSGLAILALLFWFFASDVDKQRRNIGTILILGVMALCVWSLVPQPPHNDPDGAPVTRLKPGIDLAGGSAFTVRIQPKVDDQTKEIIPVDAVVAH